MVLLMNVSIVFGQITPTANQNFIYVRTIAKEGVKTASDLSALSADSVLATVQYFDGLGRPLQNVAVRTSPAKKDIITPVAYDTYGRQDKSFLPYEHNSQNGAYQSTAITAQASFYNTAGSASIPKIVNNPFTQTLFEKSSLNRVLEIAPPGESWKLGNGHTVRSDREINKANEVRLWNITVSGSSNTGGTGAGYYGAGQLYKNITWDENRNRVIEYLDKEGLVICKKIQDGGDTASNPTYMTTQYVYDDYGGLAYVLPPALEAITSFTEQDQNFLNYIYAYHYDGKRRLIEKKNPGKGWEYTVYNIGNKPVMVQDSMQRARGNWGFMKYDTLGRLIMTGEIQSTFPRDFLQSLCNSETRLYEVRNNGLSWGYSNEAYPRHTERQVFTVQFYDDYSFLTSTVNPNPLPTLIKQPAGSASESNRTHGIPTITVTNVLDSAKYLYKSIYYDEKGRVTKMISQHLLNGADIVTNTFNFVGSILTRVRSHYKDNFSVPALTITTTNQYDHSGRVVRAIEKINSQTPDTITYTYNQVGQLSQKKVGNQKVETFFNARGWVKKQSAPLFTIELKYDSTAVATNKQFNGNVGQQIWQSGSGSPTQRTYTYVYDRANRVSSGTSDEGYNEQGITYDKMGNITALTRPKSSATAITYNYGTKGNQLQSVSGGYARGYTYNGNGSVITMTGTNPLTIVYNALNLPKTITGTASVSYVYDAAGNKLKKTTVTETRWYIDGIEYITNSTIPSPAIDLLHTSEGVARRSGTTYNYEYFLKDHLGNTRIVFNKADAVLQQTDYYPFGMSVARVANTPNRYLYNGKEQQQELGGTDGGQYDYGARFYDPVIGRWHVADPLAEKMPRYSVYSYAFDNPIRFIDPDGRVPEDPEDPPKIILSIKNAKGHVTDFQKSGDVISFWADSDVDADGAGEKYGTTLPSTSLKGGGNRKIFSTAGKDDDIDPFTTSYSVIPGGAARKTLAQNGVDLGDVAMVINTGDKDRKSTFSIIADIGPANKTGENSIKANNEIGLKSSKNGGGGDANDILTIIFAGSRERFNEKGKAWSTGGKLPNDKQIQALGVQLLIERIKNAKKSIPNYTHYPNFD